MQKRQFMFYEIVLFSPEATAQIDTAAARPSPSPQKKEGPITPSIGQRAEEEEERPLLLPLFYTLFWCLDFLFAMAGCDSLLVLCALMMLKPLAN